MYSEITLSNSTITPRPPRSLRRFIWKGGGMVAIFIATLIISNFFISTDRAVTRRMLGHDFLVFYFGGTCARTGQMDKIFDLDATRAFEFNTGHAANLEMGTNFGPWWNPPFAAWMFAPFSMLPYRQALLTWWAFGFTCAGISMLMMAQMLPKGWKNRLVIPLLMTTCMPFFQAFSHGQNTFFSLFLLTSTVVLWRAEQSLLAGMVCGLMFYKPQLGAVVAIVLCLSQGRRALLGVAITGTFLLLVNVITMPGTLEAWLFRMPGNLHWMQEENHYLWERHVTFKGFWRLLIQGRATGSTAISVLLLWGVCEAVLLGALLKAIWKTIRGPRSRSQTDRLICAMIVSMPLLMPFYFDYDLLLISVAAVLYTADRIATYDSSAGDWENRWLPRIWITLFITLEFGTMMAGHTRVHPVVPLVTVLSALLIRRTLRGQVTAIATIPQNDTSTVALAA